MRWRSTFSRTVESPFKDCGDNRHRSCVRSVCEAEKVVSLPSSANLQDSASFSGQLMHKEGRLGHELTEVMAENHRPSCCFTVFRYLQFVCFTIVLFTGGVYRPYKDKDAVGSIQEVLLAGFDGDAPEDGLEIHVKEEDLKAWGEVVRRKAIQDMFTFIYFRVNFFQQSEDGRKFQPVLKKQNLNDVILFASLAAPRTSSKNP